MKKILLMLIILLTLLLVACGETKDSTKKEETNEVSETPQKNNVVEEKEDIEKELIEINNYVVSDVWNDGIWTIKNYAETGKDGMGNELDVNFTIEILDSKMEEKPEHDKFIANLDDKEYEQVKMIWGKLSPEIDKAYNYVKENGPTANTEYGLDTGLFSQYMNAFSDEVVK